MNTKRYKTKYKSNKKEALKAVKSFAREYQIQRHKLIHDNSFFFQHYDSMMTLRKVIRYYGLIYKTWGIVEKNRQDLLILERSIPKLRKILKK